MIQRLRYYISGTLPILLAVTTLAAPSSAPNWPKLVSNSIAENVANCRETKFFKGFVSRKAYFNADGVKDYIIDYAHLSCDGLRRFHCGSGGCLTEIFVLRGKGGGGGRRCR